MSLKQRTIAEISMIWPEAGPVLEAHGIDNCCGGAHTLAEAAEAHGIAVGQVVAELEDAGVQENQDGAAGAEPVVDVRPLAPRDKHPKIFSTFDALPVGGALTLVNDHDPQPLFYQMQAERPGQVGWEPQEEGPERWVIRIARVA